MQVHSSYTVRQIGFTGRLTMIYPSIRLAKTCARLR